MLMVMMMTTRMMLMMKATRMMLMMIMMTPRMTFRIACFKGELDVLKGETPLLALG